MSLIGTSGMRGTVGETVTADLALSIGRAVASRGTDRLVVGHDPRETSSWLVDALTAGARECGADVIDAGLVATPTLARAVEWTDADLGVVVTASHNPPQDNGFKFWRPTGRAYDASDCRQIADRVNAQRFDPTSWDDTGDRTTVGDATNRHVDALTNVTSRLDELDVVVDVGNGAGGVTARALEVLGADVRVLNGSPDGRFPNRPSEPTEESCEKLQTAVVETGADFGVAHDGDADRAMAVTESGRFVSGDVLLAVFGRAVATAGDRIAAPINTSHAVDEALADVGASVTRTPIGDVHIAERVMKPDVVFGGEPSGAWIWPDQILCPDGPLAACRLAQLVRAEGSLDAYVDSVETFPLHRRSIETESKRDVMERVRGAVQREFPDRCTKMDGVHVEFDDGWFLVRASGTQPLVRVTAEGHTEDRAAELLERAEEFVRVTPRQ